MRRAAFVGGQPSFTWALVTVTSVLTPLRRGGGGGRQRADLEAPLQALVHCNGHQAGDGRRHAGVELDLLAGVSAGLVQVPRGGAGEVLEEPQHLALRHAAVRDRRHPQVVDNLFPLVRGVGQKRAGDELPACGDGQRGGGVNPT